MNGCKRKSNISRIKWEGRLKSGIQPTCFYTTSSIKRCGGLWQKIMKDGPDFFEDLSIFKKEKEAMKNKCLRKGKFLTKLWVRKKVQGYKLKTNISKELNTTCTKMTMNELKYLSYLQRKLTKQLQDVDDNRIVLCLLLFWLISCILLLIISCCGFRIGSLLFKGKLACRIGRIGFCRLC